MAGHRRHRLSDDGQWLAYAVDVAGRGRHAHRAQPASDQEFKARAARLRSSRPTASWCSSRSCRRRAGEERQARRGAAPGARGAGARRRRRRRRSEAGAPRGAQLARHHEPRRWPGHDDRARQQLPAAGRVLGVGGLSPRPGRRRQRRGGRGGGAGRAGGAGRQGGAPATPPATPAAQAGGAPAGDQPPSRSRNGAAAPEKTKTNGTDLIIRNLATGAEVTLPRSPTFWTRMAARWPTWCRRPTRRRTASSCARPATRRCDGPEGQGQLPEPGVRRSREAGGVPQRSAEYDKKVSPYRLYYWKVGDPAASELVSGATKGMPAGMVVSERLRAALLRRRRTSAPRHGAAAGAAGEPGARAAVRVDLWSAGRCADSADAAGACRAGAQPQLSRGRAPRRQAVRPAGHAGPADGQPGRRSESRDRPQRPAVSAGNLVGHDLQRRVHRRPKNGRRKKILEHAGAA